jgi:hypothetical protein
VYDPKFPTHNPAIFDKLIKHLRDTRSQAPVGFVQIFLETENGILYDEGFNLVVAQGREFIAQRIFNKYEYLTGTRSNWTNFSVSHFAVGSGGSAIVESSVELQGPFICDTSLYSPISLGVSGYLSEPDSTPTCVKGIETSSGSLYLEPTTFGTGDECTYYTKMQCTCIIPSGEPELITEPIKIDEAGLYFSDGSTANLFAHICFAPKWKEIDSGLTILWYVLF